MPKDTPRLWDYREPRWGWSATFEAQPFNDDDDWTKVSTMGFGTGLREGDYVGLAGPAYRGGDKDAVAFYQLTKFSYVADPPDMWKAVLVYKAECPVKEFTPQSFEQVFYVRSDR